MGRAWFKAKILGTLLFLFSFLKWFFRYSGCEFIYRKFNPQHNSPSLPTGVIWLIGLYVAFFGIASQRYENRIDVIENRRNALLTLVIKDETRRSALRNIARVQRMPCPRKPDILDPVVNFKSLFGEPGVHEETIEILQGVVEDFRKELSGADLQRADLRGINLKEANLQEANLSASTLQGTNLFLAKLEKASLLKANLRSAILAKANFEGATLNFANLQQAMLWETDLEGANLLGVDLRKANLWRVNFKGADLGWADIRETRFNLSFLYVLSMGPHILDRQLQSYINELESEDKMESAIRQLSMAKSLYGAKLDGELEGKLKKKYPHLFEKRKMPVEFMWGIGAQAEKL